MFTLKLQIRWTAVLAVGSLAALARPQALQQGFDEYVTEQIRTQHIPTVAVVIARRGQVIYEGMRNVKPTTVFPLATAGQVFTAIEIMRMVEQGKISLEEKIPRPSATYRQLLSHSSRIPEFLDAPGYECDWTSTAESLLRLTEQRPRPKEIGYSNTNFLLLTDAIGRLSGRKASDEIMEGVLRPLGMTKVRLASTASPLGYVEGQKGAERNTLNEFPDARLYGAGWEATAEDLRALAMNWEKMPALKPETWARVRQKVAGDFGLGVEVGRLPNDREFFGIEGGFAGHSAGIVHIPSINTTIVMACDMGGISAYVWASDLADIIIADDDLKNGG